MTEQAGVFNLGNYNDIESKAAGAPSTNTLTVGNAENPLIVKLAFDPRWGAKATYLETKYHDYYSQYSDDPKSKRRFLCPKNYGDKCPACDAYWTMWRENNDAVKAGKQANPQFVGPMKLFKESNRCWIIVVQPDSDSVRAMNIPFSLQRILFGGKDRSGNPVKGLVNEMREKRRSPFDLKSEIGWVRLWKTGEGIGTEYFASEDCDSVVEVDADGEEVEKRKFCRRKVSEKIFTLQLEDIPVALDCEHENSKWTAAEVAQYVKTDGVERPARVMQRADNSGGATPDNTAPAREQEFTKVENYETPPWAIAAADVPFAPTQAPAAKKEEKKAEKIEPIPHLESVVAKTAPVAQPVQQAKAASAAPKTRKVIDDLDDLT